MSAAHDTGTGRQPTTQRAGAGGGAGLAVLTPAQCRQLLAGVDVHVGRLAVHDADGRPLVMPVNYRVDGNAVVIRLEEGSLLAERAAGRPVAFEVDEVDPTWREGWSVLVQTTAEQVTDPDELDHLRALPLHPWAPGDKSLYLRLPLAMVTGRRIV